MAPPHLPSDRMFIEAGGRQYGIDYIENREYGTFKMYSPAALVNVGADMITEALTYSQPMTLRETDWISCTQCSRQPAQQIRN